ncbi:hypothetical protein VTI74DRAFT_5907 [Chaetomium olivicolor]
MPGRERSNQLWLCMGFSHKFAASGGKGGSVQLVYTTAPRGPWDLHRARQPLIHFVQSRASHHISNHVNGKTSAEMSASPLTAPLAEWLGVVALPPRSGVHLQSWRVWQSSTARHLRTFYSWRRSAPPGAPNWFWKVSAVNRRPHHSDGQGTAGQTGHGKYRSGGKDGGRFQAESSHTTNAVLSAGKQAEEMEQTEVAEQIQPPRGANPEPDPLGFF